MMLKKTALTLALSLGLVAGASANDLDFGTIGPNLVFSQATTVTGSFLDRYIFKTGPIGLTVSGTATNVTLTNLYGINNFNAKLFIGNVGSGTLIDDLSDNVGSSPKTMFGEGDLFANTPYYFTVSGTTTGSVGGRYSYNVLTTAVPEPESYALFLAGLGIMGAIARRRSKANAV